MGLSPALGKIQPSAVLEIDGERFRLLFDFDALADAERLSGYDLLANHPAAFYASMNASQLRGVLSAATDAPIARAGSLIRPDTMRSVYAAISQAWVLSMPERKSSERRPRRKLTSREIWERSYSSARVRLGLSDEQFGATTPRQLRMLLDEDGDQNEERRLLFGVVAAAIVNFSAHPPDNPVNPADFFESRRKEKPPDGRAQMSHTRAFLMSQTTERTPEKEI